LIFPNPAVRHSFRDKQSDFVLEKLAGVNRQASPFTSEIIRAGAFASDAGFYQVGLYEALGLGVRV
jgi:hypothetical protein